MSSSRFVSAAIVLTMIAACGGTPRRVVQPATNFDFQGFESSPVPIEALYRDVRRHTRRMRPGKIVHASVSRDGKWFTFASTEDRGKPQIYLQGSSAVVAAQITGNNARNLFPRISPDGRLIAFASDRYGSWQIFVSRIDSPSSVMQITDDEFENVSPSWSPDGKNLIYSSRRSGVWMMVIVDWQTGIPTILGPGMFPDWGAENLIAFQTQPTPNNRLVGIRIVEPDGRNLKNVNFDRAGKYSAVRPRWAPDGRWLVFGVLNGNALEMHYGDGKSKDLWVVRFDGTNAMPLTGEDLGEEWGASWGGTRVFYISNRDEGFENVYSFEPRMIERESKER